MVTFAVLKLDKSKEIKEEHLLNIHCINSQLDVSKFLKFTYFNDLHPSNRLEIYLILDELK